ncbi:MAG: hypothetical protein M1530_02685, partial [Candidatus Marsarchaeota archaeon]|nr:hypothetical protein [Candidatus Marsarchaeota archaeon]
MHRCLKCGRTVASVNEIAEGCACGSKVFVFSRLEGEAGGSGSISLLPQLNGKEMPNANNGHPLPASGHPLAENGRPDSAKTGEESPAPHADAPMPSAPIPPAPNSSMPSSAPIQPAPDAPSPPASAPASDSSQLPLAASPSSSRLSPSSSSVASAVISQDDEPSDPTQPYSEVWLSKGGCVQALEQPAPIQSVGAAAAQYCGQD